MLKVRVLFNDKELNMKGQIVIQCLVNCEGKAGDFQIVHCPSEMANIGFQIFDVLKNNFKDWEAGVQRKQKVDVLVKTIIHVDKGRIKINMNY